MSADYPLAKFYFNVKIGKEFLHCYEVTGLDQEAEVLEYRYGSSKEFVTLKRLGMIKTSKVVFKKAIFKDDGILNDLWKKVYTKDYNSHSSIEMTLEIELLDENGSTVVAWTVKNAFPTKFTGATLKSDDNAVAMEEIEWVHEGIETEFV